MPNCDCIFCRIAKHQSPAEIEYEDENWIAFHDINPSAPVDLLLVPKKHFEVEKRDLEENQEILGKVFAIARKVAEKVEISDSGYKLVENCGRGAGQVVDHFHIHLIGGWSQH